MNYKEFIAKYPGYENTLLDELRKNEFPQLGSSVYADWTGGAIPPKSLIVGHSNFLLSNLLGNPHSPHNASAFSTEKINETRERILKYFRTSSDEYEVIFTSNASNAILLLQHYMFEGSELLLTVDNHNTVNGLTQIARRNGAVVRYAPVKKDLTLNEEFLQNAIVHPRAVKGKCLLAYPAKSNYSGCLHSLEWVDFAQKNGWRVLLDAAAYLANNKLNLSIVKPDFVPVSFYKLFGITGVGCLLVRKDAFSNMHKKWFAGGNILMASVAGNFHILENINYAQFEDGTVNYSNIPMVIPGLDFMDGLVNVKERVISIASYVNQSIRELSIDDKKVKIYSPDGCDTVTFNFQKGDNVVNPGLFGELAKNNNYCFRVGCFCNPGINESALNHNPEFYSDYYNNSSNNIDGMTLKYFGESYGVPVGSIRSSFGYLNNYEDAEKIIGLVKRHLEQI